LAGTYVLDRPLSVGDDRAELQQRYGGKAADLVLLAHDAKATGVQVPEFSLIPRQLMRDFYVRHGHPTSLCYEPLPVAESVPAAAMSIAAGFPGFLDRTGLLAHRAGRATVLRSSLCWPPGGQTFPGVDITAFVSAWPGEGATIERLVGRLYKAYTTLCVSQAAADVRGPREAGVIVMERVGWSSQGTAYVQSGQVYVEMGPPDGPAAVYDSAAQIAASGQCGRRVADRLWDIVVDLSAAQGAGLTEVEFVVDDGKIYPVQRRILPDARTPQGVTIFHSPGTYEGPVLDLRGTPRADHKRVRGALTAGDGDWAVLVPLKDDAHVDAFALLWLAQRARVLPPAALILAAEPGGHTGIQSHLRWTLRRTLPGTRVFTVPAADLPPRVGTAKIASDGVTARWSLGT
jgi:hypothetical protein